MGDRLSKLISECMTRVFVEQLLASPRVAYYTEEIFFPQVFIASVCLFVFFHRREKEIVAETAGYSSLSVCLQIITVCQHHVSCNQPCLKPPVSLSVLNTQLLHTMSL